jgi:GrpB-like predicted nucleotidyltransferase (UPF0157 family)/GNAT superfamily N-acetyltransferase
MSDRRAAADDRRAAAARDLARAGVRNGRVELVEYDPAWPASYETERERLAPLLEALEIHHIGSTAVRGLLAKPIIDMVALVDDLDAPIAALIDSGYQYARAFNATLTHRRFLCYPTASHRTHHLHLVDDRPELERRLRFRDRLRADAALADEYVALKRALAARYPEDREAYTEAKAPFIERVEHQAGPGASVPDTASELVSVRDPTSESVSVPDSASEFVSVFDSASELVSVFDSPSEFVSVPDSASEFVSVPDPASELVLRAATVSDAEQLGRGVAEGFQSYLPFAPPGWTPRPASEEVEQVRALLDGDDFWCLLAWVEHARTERARAEQAERVGTERVLAGHVAFLSAARAWRAVEDPTLAHLRQLFLAPDHWGTGLARRLHGHAMAAAGERGFTAMRLFTPTGQARARRFYEREGWRVDGEPFCDPGFGLQLIAYRRSLG